MAFPQILKDLRGKKPLTQVEMAKIMHLSERQYQNLESGFSKPGLDQLLFLGDFFEVSLDYLTGRSDRR